MIGGLLQHLLMTLRLNLRSRQAMVYGYVIPIFFLIAFASVFRSGQPRLWNEMGMLLTITTLGGACFGMPTAMVAERERGVWRRYRLLPASTAAIVLSTMVARLLIIASAVLLQLLLARWIYDTPMPLHPFQLLIAFLFVAFAFEGMGLVIAMLADTVPAVQALGQCIFLPMIMIGGVGVPLRFFPPWARHVAGFLPGRYSVDALQACISGDSEIVQARFSLIALTLIGIAACVAGAELFRWDAGQKISPRSRLWIIAALAAWAAVGIAAQYHDTVAPAKSSPSAPAAHESQWRSVTNAQANAITYGDLQDDQSPVTPLIDSPDEVSPGTRKWMDDFRAKLGAWPPAQTPDFEQSTRNLLAIAANADLARDAHEAEIPFIVFEQLKRDIPRQELIQILTWIIDHPADEPILTAAPELGLSQPMDESDVRSRSAQYAKKLLGRLLGKLGPAQ